MCEATCPPANPSANRNYIYGPGEHNLATALYKKPSDGTTWRKQGINSITVGAGCTKVTMYGGCNTNSQTDAAQCTGVEDTWTRVFTKGTYDNGAADTSTPPAAWTVDQVGRIVVEAPPTPTPAAAPDTVTGSTVMYRPLYFAGGKAGYPITTPATAGYWVDPLSVHRGPWSSATVATNSYSAELKDLTADTYYEIKVADENDVGLGAFTTVWPITEVFAPRINDVGTIMKTEPLPPGIPPNSASTDPLYIGDITPTTVALSWDSPTDGGINVDDFHVHYRIYHGFECLAVGSIKRPFCEAMVPTRGPWQSVHSDSPKPAFTVTGLTPNAYYEFEVAAVNVNDVQGRWTQVAGPVKTQGGLTTGVPDMPSDLTITNHTHTSISLKWVGAKDNGYPVTAHTIKYRLVFELKGGKNAPLSANLKQTYGAWQTIKTESFASLDYINAYRVPGLISNTKYQLKVAAINSVGVGEYSYPVMDTTLPAPFAPTGSSTSPQQLLVRGATTDQITLQWDAPADDGGAAITSYLVGMRLAGTTDPYGTTDTGTTGTLFTTLSLPAKTRFEFFVSAVNTDGPGLLAGPVEEATLPITSPDRIIDASVLKQAITKTTITLIWTKPEERGSPITSHEIRYKAAGSGADIPYSSVDTGKMAAAFGTSHQFTIGGLTPGTKYDFHVAATNDEGQAPFSNPAAAVGTTRGTAPLPAPSVAIPFTELELPTPDLATVVKGLSPVTLYEFKLASFNPNGYSNYSDTVEEMTLGNPTGTTLGAGPAVPIFVTVPALDATATSLTVRWTHAAATAAGSAVSDYIVKYRESGVGGSAPWNKMHAGAQFAKTSSLQWPADSSTQQPSLVVHGLDSATRYDFHVASVSEDGKVSVFSTPVVDQITTGKAGPDAPLQLAAVARTTSSIEVNWKVPGRQRTSFAHGIHRAVEACACPGRGVDGRATHPRRCPPRHGRVDSLLARTSSLTSPCQPRTPSR